MQTPLLEDSVAAYSPYAPLTTAHSACHPTQQTIILNSHCPLSIVVHHNQTNWQHSQTLKHQIILTHDMTSSLTTILSLATIQVSTLPTSYLTRLYSVPSHTLPPTLGFNATLACTPQLFPSNDSLACYVALQLLATSPTLSLMHSGLNLLQTAFFHSHLS